MGGWEANQMATSTRSQSVRDQLQQALERQLGLGGVLVEVNGTNVRLVGEVAHAGELRRACELIRELAPELRLDNRLTVSQDGLDRDEALQIAAMQAFDDHAELADQQMAVVVEGSVARLVGLVTRHALIAEAVELCRRIPGITAVETGDLQSTGPMTVADSATTRLEAALALDPRLESAGLAVTVKDGIAQISGEVRKASERLAAVEIAAAQSDVRRVLARITVAGSDPGEDEMLAAALRPQLPPGCELRVVDGVAYLFGTLSGDDQQLAEAVALTTVARVVSLLQRPI
jgi:osmotically-inducible protein OsmY